MTVEYIFSNLLMTWTLTPAIHCGIYFWRFIDDLNTHSSYTLWNIFSAVYWWLEHSLQLYTVEYIFSSLLMTWTLTPAIHCGIYFQQFINNFGANDCSSHKSNVHPFQRIVWNILVHCIEYFDVYCIEYFDVYCMEYFDVYCMDVYILMCIV